MSNGKKKRSNVVELGVPQTLLPLHKRFLQIAEKGFRAPSTLNQDEIWDLCRAFIFYSAQLDGLGLVGDQAIAKPPSA